MKSRWFRKFGCQFVNFQRPKLTPKFGVSNKPGTAKVGAISKARKYQKDFKVSSFLLLFDRLGALKGGPFRDFFSEKCLTMPKKTERVPFSLTRYCMLRGKKPFWFSSLGQMVQLDTIKFRRTFRTILVSTCGLKKKSHYNSRVSLHEVPTKNVDKKQVEIMILCGYCVENRNTFSTRPLDKHCFYSSPKHEKFILEKFLHEWKHLIRLKILRGLYLQLFWHSQQKSP